MRHEWRQRRVERNGRALLWLVEYVETKRRVWRTVRRLLVDVETGEVVDDVWLDRENRVRSYSAPAAGGAPPGPGHATPAPPGRVAVERGTVPVGGAAATAAPAAGTIIDQALERGRQLTLDNAA